MYSLIRWIVSFIALLPETEREKQVSLGCFYLLSHKESWTLLTFCKYLAELDAVVQSAQNNEQTCRDVEDKHDLQSQLLRWSWGFNLSLLQSLIFTVVKLNLQFQKGSGSYFHSNFAKIILCITLALECSPDLFCWCKSTENTPLYWHRGAKIFQWCVFGKEFRCNTSLK